jgi:hypothetical protein
MSKDTPLPVRVTLQNIPRDISVLSSLQFFVNGISKFFLAMMQAGFI